MPRISFGQSAAQSGTAGVRFQILDQKRVYFGRHSVTLNRIVPPVFPDPVPQPAPTPVQLPSSVVNFGLMIFSATVYDHQFSVIHRFDGDQTLAAVSNVDFNDFTTTGSIIEGDTYYEVIIGLDNETAADADPITAAWLAQARASLPANAPAYIVVSGTPSADDSQGLDAIHAYVAANSAQLAQAYRREQARWAAAALQARLHPYVRPNTVINYWPIKSSVYLPQASQ